MNTTNYIPADSHATLIVIFKDGSRAERNLPMRATRDQWQAEMRKAGRAMAAKVSLSDAVAGVYIQGFYATTYSGDEVRELLGLSA